VSHLTPELKQSSRTTLGLTIHHAEEQIAKHELNHKKKKGPIPVDTQPSREEKEKKKKANVNPYL